MKVIFCDKHSELSLIKWRPLRSKHLTYAIATVNGNQILAHRLVAELEEWDLTGKVVDHINGNPLDNRLVNLQLITQSQNMMKQRKPSGCSSRFKGVARFRNSWRARITIDGKTKSLGVYQQELEAAAAYNAAALEIFGKYAVLNPV